MTDPLHIAAGAGQKTGLPGINITVLLSTPGFALFEETTEPGSGPPLHVHHDAEEFFRVLDGRYLFRAGEKTIEAGPGDTLLVPRDTPHAFYNPGDTPARLFMGFQPGGPEGLFRAMAGLTLPDDMEKLETLAADYGVEFLGPNPFAD